MIILFKKQVINNYMMLLPIEGRLKHQLVLWNVDFSFSNNHSKNLNII